MVPLHAKNTFNGAPLSPGDAAFAPIVQNPRLGQLLPILYPGAFDGCYPTGSREDLVTIFLKGIPGVNQPDQSVANPSEQLRLNTSVAPTPWADQKPLGLLAGQSDGFPNGRRIGDDVVDIALQAVAGATPVGQCDGQSPNNQLGDGVSKNDMPALESFPYMPYPHQGYDHSHDHTNTDAEISGDTRTARIKRLYFAYFRREPDQPGLDYWIDTGAPLAEISQLFAESDEFKMRYGTLTDAEFVDLIYLNILGRPGDAAGVAFWKQKLAAGDTRGAIMLGFSDSVEFQKLLAAK